jgi:hypothetical protein
VDRVLGTIALVAGSTAIALLTLELGLRVFYDPQSLQPRWSVYEGKASAWCCPPLVEKYGRPVFAPGIAFEHCYGARLEDSHCVGYRLNRLGFRDREHRVEKPADVLRVVLLGDSFSFGEGVERQETFFGRLSARLQSDPSEGMRYEWINMAISGGDLSTHERVYSETASRFSPDVVVLQWNTNDIHDSAIENDHHRNIGVLYGKLVLEARAIHWSHLYRHVWFNLNLLGLSSDVSEVRADPALRRANFEKLGEFKDRIAPAQLVVLIFPEIAPFDPYRYQALVDSLEEFLVDRGIAYVNALPRLREHDARSLWVHPSDHHPNARAHEVVFEQLRDSPWFDRARAR